jgi:hypothetical protein
MDPIIQFYTFFVNDCTNANKPIFSFYALKCAMVNHCSESYQTGFEQKAKTKLKIFKSFNIIMPKTVFIIFLHQNNS